MPKKTVSSRQAINVLGLSKIHPIFDKCPSSCNAILEKYIGFYSSYQSDIRYFFAILDDSIDDDLSKEKFFQQVDLYFEIYHTYDIHFFWATHFVMDYCKQDLATILDAFKYLNGIKEFKEYVDVVEGQDTILTNEELQKIFDINLIVNLAKIFSIIAHCERVVLEAGKTEAKWSDFNSLDDTIGMFKKEMGNYNREEPKAGFKIYYRKDAALKRAVLLSWKWYHHCIDSFLSMDDSTMIQYIVQNPEIPALLIRGRNRSDNKLTKINRKKIVDRFFEKTNFFYICGLLTKDSDAKIDELLVNTTSFGTDKLMIEI